MSHPLLPNRLSHYTDTRAMNPPPQHQPPLEPGDEAARDTLYEAIYKDDLPAAKALVHADPSLTRFLHAVLRMADRLRRGRQLPRTRRENCYGPRSGYASFDITKLLFRNGADLALAKSHPLIHATDRGHIGSLEMLLDYGVLSWEKKRHIRNGGDEETTEEDEGSTKQRERDASMPF